MKGILRISVPLEMLLPTKKYGVPMEFFCFPTKGLYKKLLEKKLMQGQKKDIFICYQYILIVYVYLEKYL